MLGKIKDDVFCLSRCYDVRNKVNLRSELQLKGIKIALTAHISGVQLKRRRDYAHLGVIKRKKNTFSRCKNTRV